MGADTTTVRPCVTIGSSAAADALLVLLNQHHADIVSAGDPAPLEAGLWIGRIVDVMLARRYPASLSPARRPEDVTWLANLVLDHLREQLMDDDHEDREPILALGLTFHGV